MWCTRLRSAITLALGRCFRCFIGSVGQSPSLGSLSVWSQLHQHQHQHYKCSLLVFIASYPVGGIISTDTYLQLIGSL